MKLSLNALALTVIALTACASPQTTTTPVIVYEPLQQAYTAYTSTMNEQLPPVAFESGDVATTCDQYLELKQSSSVTENTANFVAAQDYVICESVEIIKKSADNKIKISADIAASRALAERLDLRSFPSSLYQRTDNNAYTLEALSLDPLQKTQFSVKPSIESWHYELRVVARLEADGNGEEDWLVWLTDRAETGSYNILKPFIAYNVNAGLIELSPLQTHTEPGHHDESKTSVHIAPTKHGPAG